MLRRILFASAVAVPLAGAALAAPPPPTPTFTSPAFNWSGVYGGLQIGGAWGCDDACLFVPDYEILSEYDANMGAVKGGAHVGWNYQFPQFGILGDPLARRRRACQANA